MSDAKWGANASSLFRIRSCENLCGLCVVRITHVGYERGGDSPPIRSSATATVIESGAKKWWP